MYNTQLLYYAQYTMYDTQLLLKLYYAQYQERINTDRSIRTPSVSHICCYLPIMKSQQSLPHLIGMM